MSLSRRGWNNVIIFAVAGMILLFRYMDYSGPDPSPPPVDNVGQGRLLPVGAVILTLELPNRSIERSGTSWLSEPPSANPVMTIDAWLHAELEPWDEPIGGAAQSYTVLVNLAGMSDPVQLTLFELGELRLISNWQGELLLLDNDSYGALFEAI